MLNNELLEFLKSVPNETKLFVEKLKAEQGDKKIYLFGCGNHVRVVVDFLRRRNFDITAIIDTFKEGELSGIPVIRYSDFLAEKPDPEKCIIIISAPSKAKEITDTLRKSNDWNIKTFTVGLNAFIDDIDEYRNYLAQNWNELIEFADSLEDDFSRKTLECVLKGRVSGDPKYFAECYAANQYYPNDIIKFSDNEVMVDLGAYDGDSLSEFIKVCPEYRSAYCFEPQEEYFNKLNAIVMEQQKLGKGTHAIMKGAWEKSCKLKFIQNMGTGGSFLQDSCDANAENICFLDVAAVDEEVKEPITYMKMDIEGSELAALHGAKHQISENKPKLAISVYHKIEDFLDIWNYLRSLVPEYKFYLRHHVEYEMPDTVLYAVADTK
ncbi:MAG: FkbM family methyltransferase [Oscillospiraceae bacterium]|nr:FkbM family methyltransferase [Oscillospiraceae bacterium]